MESGGACDGGEKFIVGTAGVSKRSDWPKAKAAACEFTCD